MLILPQDFRKLYMLMKRIHKKSLMLSRAFRLITGAIVAGILTGVVAHGPDGMVWIFILLMLSSGIVALAQQTLP
jgi:hypothetical protein